jgi:hypothetical protein
MVTENLDSAMRSLWLVAQCSASVLKDVFGALPTLKHYLLDKTSRTVHYGVF